VIPSLPQTRRLFLLASGSAGAGMLYGCTAADDDSTESGKDVTANEDLMREHGVLRRALLVYDLSALRMERHRNALPAEPLNRTAKLIRIFGEDYHERQLEEAFVFPAVRRAGGPAATDADVLTAQHNRGREITDYILAATRRGRFSHGDAERLAHALRSFVIMYRAHTAHEDTIVFPAWKQALSAAQYDEMGDRFEDIERRMLGTDGFAEAVTQIAAIEQVLGLSDLAQLTAPPPPRA
jgi:hemerythrin-like domain-containing protein